jgi:hypothetical protein
VQIDWTSYLRVHADRRNLIIHLFAVPLFVGCIVSLILYLIRGDIVTVVIAIILAIIALALQAWGHAREVNAPVPFSSPGNFLNRWFTEQFAIFPIFVLSGRWWRQFNGTGGESGDAA